MSIQYCEEFVNIGELEEFYIIEREKVTKTNVFMLPIFRYSLPFRGISQSLKGKMVTKQRTSEVTKCNVKS